MKSIILQSQPVPTRSPGAADIIGFGKEGVVILRNALLTTSNAINNYGYSAGWMVDRHVRLVADTTGDGRSDIVGFGTAGVYVSTNNSNDTWGGLKLVVANFGYDQGWINDKHIRYMADINKSGCASIVGFGYAGVFISYNSKGIFPPSVLACTDFGYSAGWRLEKHLRFLADITGNEAPDIVGFGENQVVVAINNGNGTFQPPKGVLTDFTYSTGWFIDKHPRMLADLTGDGRADIVGFNDAGVVISLNNGDGTFQAPKQVITGQYGTSTGWTVNKHPRFVADVTGDGRGDIVGCGNAGVWIAINNGDGTFQAPKLAIRNFGVDAGWDGAKHPRFPVDLTGDGAADFIGFGEDSTWVSYNDGKGNFGPAQKLTDAFANNGGQWSSDMTVRFVANLF